MNLAFLFILFVILIRVSIYLNYYLSSDLNLMLFKSILTCFARRMVLLIFANRWLLLFISWDGLGITSFFLVLYYINNNRITGSISTVMTNRIGDYFLVVSLSNLVVEKIRYRLIITSMLILARITKSAMIPFSSWLPKAIAAPTPVSALVHSRTLVTAGIVLLTKIPIFFDYLFVKFIFLLGFVTMSFARRIALFEVDIKKVVALSTLSQLGFMMVSFSFGLVRLMMIHLFMHALFKRFLFFNVGVIINLERIQDTRRMSFSTSFISTSTKVYISFSLVSLIGFMFTSGMVSKEFIVESNLVWRRSIMIWLFNLVILLTFLYSFQIIASVLKVNNSQVAWVNNSFNSLFSSLFLYISRITIALFSIRNLLVVPVNMIQDEKAIFLFYLVLACFFFKLVTSNVDFNLDLAVGETMSVLVKNGMANVVGMKSWDILLLVKDRFIYNLRLMTSYYLSSLIKNKRLFFLLLLFLLFVLLSLRNLSFCLIQLVFLLILRSLNGISFQG